MDKYPLQPKADILILAGDIVPFAQVHEHQDFFDDVSAKFKKTYWIAGNHEYYYSDINNRSGSFIEKVRENIFLLNNSVVQEGEYSLIFSTLWTHISPSKSTIIGDRLSDFFVISNGNKKITVDDYNEIHKADLNFIKSALTHSQEMKTIVISHHVPTFRNYPLKYASSPVNEAFATELQDVIELYQPDFWIYGHSHVNTPEFMIGKTKLLTNQLGYLRYKENVGYKEIALIG